MLLFRDEEHVDRWCEQLSRAWFGEDRGAQEWRRPPLDEVESLFTSLDLTSPFWSLR